jgi:hypothetical protein
MNRGKKSIIIDEAEHKPTLEFIISTFTPKKRIDNNAKNSFTQEK